MSRGNYRQNSAEAKKRVLSSYQKGEDWAAVAEHNEVKYKTAYSWIRRDLETEENTETKRRGGPHNRKLHDRHVDALCTYLETDCSLTLRQLADKLLAEFDLVVSIQAISNQLEGRLISMKKIHVEPYAMV